MSGSETNYNDTESDSEPVKEEVKGPAYQELTQSDILQSAKFVVQKFISNTDGVSEPEARRLLQNNGWDFKKALNTERERKESERKEIKRRKHMEIKGENKQKISVTDLTAKTDSPTLECEVCKEDLCPDKKANLTCAHVFCKEFLKLSIIENINNEKG